MSTNQELQAMVDKLQQQLAEQQVAHAQALADKEAELAAASGPSVGVGVPPDYVYHAFPKAMYHKDSPLKARVVGSEEELKALGDGWADSPAKHGKETHPQAVAE